MSKITAVLGPTNTGKTYLAMEAMKGYSTAIMGFPLRLLARENYDRLIESKGKHLVALVTGEEKIIPKDARYWICTVESMPLDLKVDFVAIDEIQLCADPERGHIFTERLLTARGTHETMFLGAETARRVINALIPKVNFVTRPRLSTLSYIAPKKLSRIPPRSAVVVFSASQVYQVASMIRQHRGGAAVVLGALSPRTRNAQVAMYQAGEVDYMVATDAIGMGLNMDIDHVTFSALKKFDGRGQRYLSPQEIGQIAGRAGRHMNDGTFCCAADIRPPDEDLIEAVENHRYDPLEYIFWRNNALDYRSVYHLQKSLDGLPKSRALQRTREAEDQRALNSLSHEDDLKKYVASPAATRVLWDICQIPDFHKSFTDTHQKLQRRVFLDLMGPANRINVDWAAKNIDRLDDTTGEIDTLVNRIANVRTWTYISHRADWMPDPKIWQNRTRDIEDRLSDALHDRLTNQFVDRRAAILVRRLKEGGELLSGVQADGSVVVEGEFVGKIKGFHFEADQTVEGPEGKTILTAARKALGQEISKRLEQFHADNDGAFSLGDNGTIDWRGAPIADVAKGSHLLSPDVRMNMGELVDTTSAKLCEERVKKWLAAHLKNALSPLENLKELGTKADVSAGVRALAYQLWEALGLIDRRPAKETIQTLSQDDRGVLRNAGVRFGRKFLFVPSIRQPRTQRVLGILSKAAGMESLPHSAATRFDLNRPNRPHKDNLVLSVDQIERSLNRMWRQENEPKSEKPTAEIQVEEAKPEGIAEVSAEATATVTIEAPAEAAEAPTETVEATAEQPAQKSQAEIFEEVKADLLVILDGDNEALNAVLALPEAKRFGPKPGQNRNRRPAAESGAGTDTGPDSDKKGGKPKGRPQSKGTQGKGKDSDRPKNTARNAKGGKGNDRNQKPRELDPEGKRLEAEAAKRRLADSPFAALAGLKLSK
ncbi:MAG: helicase-related protein [Alphaproteobacteria bacterium]